MTSPAVRSLPRAPPAPAPHGAALAATRRRRPRRRARFAAGGIWIGTQVGRRTGRAGRRLRHALAHPAARRVDVEPTACGCSSSTRSPATTEFVPQGATPTLGLQRLLPRSDPRRRAGRARAGRRHQLARHRDDHRPLARHAPAGRDGRRAALADRPGATWHPEWTIDQPAATLWYHPHLHGETRAQVDAGWPGMFLVRRPEEAALALPRDYGGRRHPRHRAGPRVLGRRRLRGRPRHAVRRRARRHHPRERHARPLPRRDDRARAAPAAQRARARACYDFAFDDGRAVRAHRDRRRTARGAASSSTAIPLSPGERAEIVVTSRPGERVVLQSQATADPRGMIDSIAA